MLVISSLLLTYVSLLLLCQDPLPHGRAAATGAQVLGHLSGLKCIDRTPCPMDARLVHPLPTLSSPIVRHRYFVSNRDGIVAVWAPPVALDNDHVLHTLGGAGGLVANLRSQVLASGLAGVVAFCRGVRTAAADRDGDAQEIDQEDFRAAASFAGAELTVRFSLSPFMPNLRESLPFCG